MSNFEFGLKAILPTTRGIKSHVHQRDESLRLFVSIEQSKEGKEKGKFRFTDGAMDAMNLKAGDYVAIANNKEGHPAGTCLFANVTGLDNAKEIASGKISSKGTFYNLKLVNALQMVGLLPQEITGEIVFDVKLVSNTPPVVMCALTGDVIAPAAVVANVQPGPDDEEDDQDLFPEEEEVELPDEIEEEEEESLFGDADFTEGDPLL